MPWKIRNLKISLKCSWINFAFKSTLITLTSTNCWPVLDLETRNYLIVNNLLNFWSTSNQKSLRQRSDFSFKKLTLTKMVRFLSHNCNNNGLTQHSVLKNNNWEYQITLQFWSEKSPNYQWKRNPWKDLVSLIRDKSQNMFHKIAFHPLDSGPDTQSYL
jgi:hypothetical protein